MDLGDIFNRLFTKNEGEESYEWEAVPNSIDYYVSDEIANRIQSGDAPPWITNQYITLRMLVEQELAEEMPNGFILPSESVVNLDKTTRDILELPPQWEDKIKADIKGVTGESSFSVSLSLKTKDGKYTSSYKNIGPIVQLSSTQQYILSSAQFIIFSALAKHQASDKSEYNNLQLIYALQTAQAAGASIDLAHFEKLNIKAPESISIEAELDDEGNLILTPYMGQDAPHEKIQKVLGQLRSEHASALRVEDEIILFDKERLEAVHEILSNRKIPKDKVQDFFKNPTSYIDASLVDLDVGFSARVHGATRFKHAYFGETDESGIDWFGASTGAVSIFPISKLQTVVDTIETLNEFKTQLADAYQVGAVEIEFENKYFDISDKEAVSKEVSDLEIKLTGGDVSGEGNNTGGNNEGGEDEPDTAVVDVDLNDEALDMASPIVADSIEKILYAEDRLDWSNYSRLPFDYQKTGIRWILGLALENKENKGGLLADDMGLGKTLMSLSAVDQLYKVYGEQGNTKKPCLVVAPLSLLQNWKDEVDLTFSNSPFKDVVILQSDGQLPKYRVAGVETRLQDLDEDTTGDIRYSLKVGKTFSGDRLDMPQRLVITTYQALRDYQFSLCSIDWSMVIFDESQNIKNPNALQTRAAKGLKADFKLVATGTPVENSLADFWCLMDTACPGHLHEYQDFRQRYITPILQAAGDEVEEVRGRIGRELRLKVGPLMLRRVKEDHLEGLPKKYIHVGVEGHDLNFMPVLKSLMEGVQLQTYNSALSVQGESESNIVLAGLQRLRDVSLHPQLADGGQLKVSHSARELDMLISESGKMQSLISVLDNIKKVNEKCIVFAVNKRLQTFLSLALGQKYKLGPIPVINGDIKAVSKKSATPTRKSIISNFETRDGFNIIIMSPVAAGVGLTIVGANNVIHFERHWNPAKEAQATDRVYRIGQTKDVNVYIPILHHPVHESFDVNLHTLLSKKTLLKDAVVTPEQVVPNPGGFGEGFEPNYRIYGKDLGRLSWQHFEALSADLLMMETGAKSCHLTKSSSDGGADVVLTDESGIQLIQCKHTQTAKYDGYKAIQEVYSAKPLYEKSFGKVGTRLIFITNAKSISKQASKYAKEFDVEIISFKKVNELLEKHVVTFGLILKRLNQKPINIS